MTEDIDLGSAAGDCGVGIIADDLRALYLHPPVERVAQAHLRCIRDAVDGLDAPGEVTSLDARRRSGRWAVGAAAAGAVVLTGGLAAAGELPAAIQERVASIVAPTGIHLPTGRADRPGPNEPSIDPTVSLPPYANTNGRLPADGGQGVGHGESDKTPGAGGIEPGKDQVAPGHAGGLPSTVPPSGPAGATDPGKAPVEHDPAGNEADADKDKTPKSEVSATTSTTAAGAGADESVTGADGSGGSDD